MAVLLRRILLFVWISCSDALPMTEFPSDPDDSTGSCSGENGAPLITPCKSSIILEDDTTITLKCEGDQPISWWSSATTSRTDSNGFENTADPRRPYGSSLTLSKVSIFAVGAYYCVKDSELNKIAEKSDEAMIELVNQGRASSIYVYVDDIHHKIVITFSEVEALQYTDVVIPCKPAMPDTEVCLKTSNGDEYCSKSFGRYDPKRGFTIKILRSSDGGEYVCRPISPFPDKEYEDDTIEVNFIANGHVDIINKPLPKPVITTSVGHHVITGTNFTLACEQSAFVESLYRIELLTPSADKNRSFTTAEIDPKTRNSTHLMCRRNLTILNAQKSDSGTYNCITTDNIQLTRQSVSYMIKVIGPNESYLNVYEPSGLYNVQKLANSTILMRAAFEGYPTPTFSWFKPDGTEVGHWEHNFKIVSEELGTMLQVLNAQLQDSGIYTLKSTNSMGSVHREYNVSVIDGPVLSMSDVYVQAGSVAHMECNVRANPSAIVTFFFQPCGLEPRWPTCERNNQNFSIPSVREKYQFQSKSRPGKLSVESIYNVSFLPTEPGILTCFAQNLVNGQEQRSLTQAHVLLGDNFENITIHGFDKHHKIAKGEYVNFTCEALAYNFDSNLVWLLNGIDLRESEHVQIETSRTKYFYISTLHITSIADIDQGTYECRAYDNRNISMYSSREISLIVNDPFAPVWVNTSLNDHSKIKRKLSEGVELDCDSKAIPLATVRWYKDDKDLDAAILKYDFVQESNSTLRITNINPLAEGVYRCVVENRLNRIERSFTVVITDLPGISMAWVWFGVILFLILISLCLFLAVRYQKEHKRHQEMKAAGLAYFEEGAVGHINPDRTLDEQAELLPYNREFEFPRDNLKLGIQLGAGAFGVVLKGEARGIRKEEPMTTVAVKMVKRTADNEVVRALVSELKIMVHLGQHLNVVNLLGAVTKNIAKRELMVIVEYCRFGNIQNFLLRNRKCFINQISPDTDHIDPSIMTQRISDNFDLHRDAKMDNCTTVMTTVPKDSTEAMTVTTVDLISWAFQVARGMDYLSSKKVLHGDLAARNILLCENNVVKICDFGLARTMYRTDNYKKSKSGKLPIKWLALESLSDHVFSTYSDVWSYGIVLWEMFSLAKVPYPGIDPNHELFNKLNDGYRMEKPPYANQELYEIMLECWRKNPESRPLFAELDKRFGHILSEDVSKHYIDLNNPYMQSNMEYAKSHSTDYLALMGSPVELAPTAPRYVNRQIVPKIRGPAIFSPTRLENDASDFLELSSETTFKFPGYRQSPTLSNNLNNGSSMPTLVAAGKAPEVIPILHRRSMGASHSHPLQPATSNELQINCY